MAQVIHVFRCESTDLYGVTNDRTGANLPTDECTAGWQFVRTVEFTGGIPPRGMNVAWQEQIAAVRAAVTDHGFFIGEAGVLPAEII